MVEEWLSYACLMLTLILFPDGRTDSQINPTIYNSWTWEGHIAGVVDFGSEYPLSKCVLCKFDFKI